MAGSLLVSLDLAAGARIVSILQDAGIELKVAVWISTTEYEEGRILLASPMLDQNNPLRAHDKVANILHGKFNQLEPGIWILPMKDPLIKDLRRNYAKAKNTEPFRFGGHTMGNRFVLEGYAYLVH